MHNAHTINQKSILALPGILSACLAGTAVANVILAGDMDDFGNSYDPDDTLIIRPLFEQYLLRPNGHNTPLHNGEHRPFDTDGTGNWDFGYTFENLPTLRAGAKLTIRLRAENVGGVNNDAIGLQYTGDGSNFSMLWNRGIAQLNGGSWVAGEAVIFELDLDNLLGGVSIIDDINAVGYLDVMVWDDSSVDWIELTIPAPGSASLLALGVVTAVRRRRR